MIQQYYRRSKNPSHQLLYLCLKGVSPPTQESQKHPLTHRESEHEKHEMGQLRVYLEELLDV